MKYIGNREGLRDAMNSIAAGLPSPAEHQVIDLVALHPSDPRLHAPTLDLAQPAVVLSSRRVELSGELGDLEESIMRNLETCVLLRCAPLDRSMDFYRYWVEIGGVLLSSINDAGVAWLAMDDLAEAAVLAGQDIGARSGQAFDVTGPTQVSMRSLARSLSAEIGITVEHQHIPPDAFSEILIRNGVPSTFASWLPKHQAETSNPGLVPVTTILSSILGRPAAPPEFARTVDNEVQTLRGTKR